MAVASRINIGRNGGLQPCQKHSLTRLQNAKKPVFIGFPRLPTLDPALWGCFGRRAAPPLCVFASLREPFFSYDRPGLFFKPKNGAKRCQMVPKGAMRTNPVEIDSTFLFLKLGPKMSQDVPNCPIARKLRRRGQCLDFF